MSFILFGPGGNVVDTETASVSGNGNYTTPTGYVPSVAGTYQWLASYGGDGNNTGAATSLGTTSAIARRREWVARLARGGRANSAWRLTIEAVATA